jgi:hypothetical protein
MSRHNTKRGRFSIEDCDRLVNRHADSLASFYAEACGYNDNDTDVVIYVRADDARGWRSGEWVPDRVGDYTVEELAAEADRNGPGGVSFAPLWVPRRDMLPPQGHLTGLAHHLDNPARVGTFYVVVCMDCALTLTTLPIVAGAGPDAEGGKA